jgi:hypothetical protein
MPPTSACPLCSPARLCGLFARQLSRVVTASRTSSRARAELVSGRPQHRVAIVVEVCVEGVSDGSQRAGPHSAAPSHMLYI